MVQVDVFWSYGIGAGLAVAAHRQIMKQKDVARSLWEDAMQSPFFSKLLLFLGLVFVPSGFWLLWQFSSWETMHAGDRNLPVWLVGLFAITNVSQGVLGFVICHHLIRRGKLYAAWLNFIAAYFGMFFILVHGWDGKGYQRFFSPDRAAFENWSWQTAGAWFTSDIALTLYGMGVILLPILGGMTLSWIREGAREAGVRSNPMSILGGFFGSVLIFTVGLAIVSSVAIINLGPIVGTLLSFILILITTHPRLGVGAWFYRTMTVEPSMQLAPASAEPA
ncbi:MAG TPA: hypothetical protein VE954_04930 [Oligoflexus sp.]|uniref:hypothetical protein n=1 Tax=Oligoflexus sp. TaxID=1971216 RepID=UPI002D4A9071|nr:hypothetical protein [Oligoflexus sp.]HYX32436.1 hypothetical protein [Oligoflexus sp.]